MSDRDDCPECGMDVQFQGHYPGCSLDPKNKPAPSLYEKLSVRPGDQFVVPVSPVQWDAIKELSKPAPECVHMWRELHGGSRCMKCGEQIARAEPAAPVEGLPECPNYIAHPQSVWFNEHWRPAFEAMRERLRRVHCASSEEHDVRCEGLTARVQELEGQAERQASEMHFIVQASQRLREERDEARTLYLQMRDGHEHVVHCHAKELAAMKERAEKAEAGEEYHVEEYDRMKEERDRALTALAYAKDALSIFPDDLAEIARIVEGGE